MSIKAMTWVWEHSTLKGARLLMLLAIADWCNEEGECYYGTKRLQKKARLSSQNAVSNMLRAIEKTGELTVIVHDGRETGHGKTNRYYLAKYRETLELETPLPNRSEFKTYDGPPKKSKQESEGVTSGLPQDIIGGLPQGVTGGLPNTLDNTLVDTKDIADKQVASAGDVEKDRPLPQCGKHHVDCLLWWDNNECSSIDKEVSGSETCKHCGHKFEYDGKRSDSGIFECPQCHECVDYIVPIGDVFGNPNDAAQPIIQNNSIQTTESELDRYLDNRVHKSVREAKDACDEIIDNCPTMNKYGECTALDDDLYSCLKCEWQNELPETVDNDETNPPGICEECGKPFVGDEYEIDFDNQQLVCPGCASGVEATCPECKKVVNYGHEYLHTEKGVTHVECLAARGDMKISELQLQEQIIVPLLDGAADWTKTPVGDDCEGGCGEPPQRDIEAIGSETTGGWGTCPTCGKWQKDTCNYCNAPELQQQHYRMLAIAYVTGRVNMDGKNTNTPNLPALGQLEKVGLIYKQSNWKHYKLTDAGTQMCDNAEGVLHSEIEEQRNAAAIRDKSKSESKSKYKELFAAISEAIPGDSKKRTKSSNSVIGKATKELLEVGAKPDEMKVLYSYCKKRFDIDVTAMCMAKYYADFLDSMLYKQYLFDKENPQQSPEEKEFIPLTDEQQTAIEDARKELLKNVSFNAGKEQ